jgi:hypothetical protein
MAAEAVPDRVDVNFQAVRIKSGGSNAALQSSAGLALVTHTTDSALPWQRVHKLVRTLHKTTADCRLCPRFRRFRTIQRIPFG